MCDEGDITLYVNGNVGYTAKSGYAATQFYALNGIRFGNESASGNLGSLRYRYCQVRFWSVARSVEELNNNRYAVPADTPGLLGYWKLNEYTEGKAMVPGSSVKCIEEDTLMTETETYLFKDATGKQPDALIHRASANTPTSSPRTNASRWGIHGTAFSPNNRPNETSLPVKPNLRGGGF